MAILPTQLAHGILVDHVCDLIHLDSCGGHDLRTGRHHPVQAFVCISPSRAMLLDGLHCRIMVLFTLLWLEQRSILSSQGKVHAWMHMELPGVIMFHDEARLASLA